MLIGTTIGGNLPASLVTNPNLALYNAQATAVPLVVGAVLIATGILSFLRWLLAGALRH